MCKPAPAGRKFQSAVWIFVNPIGCYHWFHSLCLIAQWGNWGTYSPDGNNFISTSSLNHKEFTVVAENELKLTSG